MSEWILTSERLPEAGDICIVSGKMKYEWENEYEYFVDIAEHIPTGYVYCSTTNDSLRDWETSNDWYEGQQEYEILAWQPLPKPYKGEQDDE